MHKKFFALGATLAGLAVVLGAFGAHGLEKLATDEKTIQGFKTGTQYQFYHALSILLLAGLYDRMPVKLTKWAINSFIVGIILFSGSLYLLSFLKIQNSTAVKVVGPITPLGGLCFIAGWIFVIMAALQKK